MYACRKGEPTINPHQKANNLNHVYVKSWYKLLLCKKHKGGGVMYKWMVEGRIYGNYPWSITTKEW